MTRAATLFDYPPPARRGQETQAAAARAIRPHAPGIRARVFAAIRCRAGGATNEEISRAEGIRLCTVCGRVAELRAAGLVEDSGLRRPGPSGVAAKVWKATSEIAPSRKGAKNETDGPGVTAANPPFAVLGALAPLRESAVQGGSPMRVMSFHLTADAMRLRLKWVTRRLGWWNLKPGERLLAVEKARGVRLADRKVLGVIEVVSTRREPLSDVTLDEVQLEGFPTNAANARRLGLNLPRSVEGFIAFFRASHRKHGRQIPHHEPVNRIEFRFVRGPAPSREVGRQPKSPVRSGRLEAGGGTGGCHA